MSTVFDPIDAVIFDMDGTLLDTEPIYRDAMMQACRDLGYTMSDALHAAHVGIPAADCDALVLGAFGDDFPLQEYNELTHVHFERIAAGGIALKAGAREFVRELRERSLPAAVATSTGSPLAQERLHAAGLLDHFETVVTRNDVSQGKPHPESYLLAAQRVGKNPGRCLALEDSPNGVRSAHAAGMQAVMVPDILVPDAEIAGLCRAVIPSLFEVMEALFAAERTNQRA